MSSARATANANSTFRSGKRTLHARRSRGTSDIARIKISQLSQIVTSGELGNRIPVLVHALPSRHQDEPTGDR